MKINVIFAWFDFWVGAYYDRSRNWLYILPIPMVGFILKLPQRRYWLVSNTNPDVVTGSTIKEELEHCMREDNVHGRPYWAMNGETRPCFGTDYTDDLPW